MADYSTLLIGGEKKVRKALSPEALEKRKEALAKGRATAAKNREAKKGAGLVGSAGAQDMLDTPQVMYAGNPVDVLQPDVRALTGKGKKMKKMSKKDLACIALAKAEEEGKSESETEMCGGAKKKMTKSDMMPEALRRLGDIASNFVLTMA